MKSFLIAACLFFLGGCAVGVTVTNSPDTLPCAPGKGIRCWK